MIRLFVLCALLLPAGTWSQSAPGLRLAEIERLPGNQVRLTFEDAGTNGILNYVPAQLSSLALGATNYLDPTARIWDLGGGRYQTIIDDPAQASAFFRIAGFTGPDTDGDGLSDSLERFIGTSTNTFDTDLDGFGDGVELVNNSSPTNPNSKPLINRANFAATSSAAREGGSSINLRVNFTLPFTGTLAYRIADMSTALSGVDFVPVSGTVDVLGVSQATIPITLVDDQTIEDTKLLAVDLVDYPYASYQVGGASRHVVLLNDNDAHWSGVMRTGNSAELGFRLRMLRVGGSVTAALVSELSTNSSQGVGSIPLGVWPVTATLTTNSFQAVSTNIPMGTSLLTGNVPLQRVLTFAAAAGATNSLVRSNMIIGQFTDTLSSSDPGMAWVGGSVTGLVVLIEDLPVLPPRQLPGGEALRSLRAAQANGGGQ